MGPILTRKQEIQIRKKKKKNQVGFDFIKKTCLSSIDEQRIILLKLGVGQ